MPRSEFVGYIDRLLEASRFKDYCPNGLQVEGADRVRRVASGVTASRALLEQAIAWGADTLIVHHGYFWRGEDPRVIGPARVRLGLLLTHQLNLMAWHLPLDAHPTLGNNASLGELLGWTTHGRGGGSDLICYTDLDEPWSAQDLARHLAAALGREPLLVGDLTRRLRRIAWCTGGAQDFLGEAIALGADAFVSGEISERTTHQARELGVIYASAGHHATERYGIQALGRHLAEHFGVVHQYFEDPNPV